MPEKRAVFQNSQQHPANWQTVAIAKAGGQGMLPLRQQGIMLSAHMCRGKLSQRGSLSPNGFQLHVSIKANASKREGGHPASISQIVP